MSSLPPVRIALVGCGRISANHFEAIDRIEGMTLVAVCDAVESRAREAGDKWHVPSFTNYEQMLAQVPGDAIAAHWDLDVQVVLGSDASVDFRGPAVQGKRGDRFLYLTWGNVDNHGRFEMFRRAKLMLNRIDRELVSSAEQEQRPLVATVRLRDAYGGPRCARVDPPDLEWKLG